jgi:hypothetical protein
LVDREVFDRRLGRLEVVLRSLRGLAGVERERFLHDLALQAQAERWLYVAAECSLDLAHHLIADRGWKTPATYREAFMVRRPKGRSTTRCRYRCRGGLACATSSRTVPRHRLRAAA